MKLCTQIDMLLIQLGSVLRYTPVKGFIGSWLTPDRYHEGGALGYKSMGRPHFHDRIIINTIKKNSTLTSF
jgi:hypothetical protein